MTLDGWTLALQTLNLVVLLWLLSRFLFKPVARIIAERRKTTDALLAAAQAARAEAEREREAAREAREALAHQRAETLQATERDAKAQSQHLLEAARHEAEAWREQAERQLAAEQRDAQSRLETQAGELAVDIARRLVARLPAESQVLGFIDGLVEAIQALDPEQRRHLNEAAETLTLSAPRPLSDAERERCQNVLNEALGRAVTFKVDVDPALIAGLALEGGGLVVRNHLRADLARLEGALTATPSGSNTMPTSMVDSNG